MSGKGDGPEPVPVVKVGLKRLNLEERVLSDDELRDCPLVRLLGLDTARQVLAASQGRRFTSGARIFVEGDGGDSLFLVLKGEVRLAMGQGSSAVDLALVRKGEFLGEREALGDATARSCSAQAVGEVEVIELQRPVLAPHLTPQGPLLRHLRELAQARQAAGAEMADFLNRW